MAEELQTVGEGVVCGKECGVLEVVAAEVNTVGEGVV